MKKLLFLVFSLLLLLSCGSDDNTVASSNPDSEAEAPNEGTIESDENNLLQLQGTQLVDANQNPIFLQGVAFNNFIWSNTPEPEPHHTEEDYVRVRNMGMNSIRFYMNYSYFEDDANPYAYRQSGWDWLDQNIAWAKKHGIYLVLNMHVPQGGYQSQGEGDALWENVENQNRLIALWQEIAARYADEVQIVGFGPVNEPVPTESMQQWSDLAQLLIDGIRTVNKNHLIFIESAIYVKDNFVLDENFNFPSVSGENLIYEFHGYDPYLYTHQLLEFAQLGDGGKYPDGNYIETTDSQWYTATFDNPILPAGNSDWAYFEGVQYKITDENIDLATPVLVGENVAGRVHYDDIIIKEYDDNGNFTRNVYEVNPETLDNWYYWSANDSGNNGLSTSQGHNDSTSFYIENASGDCNMSDSRGRFEPKMEYSYEISGWMKGENVSENATCMLRLDFSTVTGPVLKRNKEYLERKLGNIVDWAKNKGVVLYMGEFGAGLPCFENDKGGLIWIADMVDILKTNKIHFTYHTYHEDAFGLYLGNGLPDPNNVNQPLIDWFTANLN